VDAPDAVGDRRGLGRRRRAIAQAAERLARIVGLLQRGRIAVYLTYSFATLIALLFLTR